MKTGHIFVKHIFRIIFRIETSEGESISSGSELSLVATSGSSIDYQIQPESSVVGESTTLYVTLIS